MIKRVVYCTLFMVVFILPLFSATLTEGFNSTGWGTSYGNYTVNSWSLTNVYRETTNKYEGASAVRFNTSGSVKSIVSPQKSDGLGTLTFWYRRWSAADGSVALSVYKSTDGSSWGSSIGTVTASSDTYSQYSLAINDASAKYIKVEAASTTKRCVLDYFVITDPTVSEPTAQPTSLVFNNVTSSSFDVAYTAASGSPAGYLAVRRTGSQSEGTPIDNKAYAAGDTLGADTVVYCGSGVTFPQSSLSAGTTYYYRIFSYNGSGATSNYLVTSPLAGSQATSSGLSKPSVTTAGITNIGYNSASGGGEVTADGGATVTARGVCWNTSGTPTLSDYYSTDDSGVGVFTSSLTSLDPNQLYYVRAYATNSQGTSYGTEVSFTTYKAEPTNHVSNFTASVVDYKHIIVTWTDTVADGYVVKMSTVGFSSIADPVDGVVETASATVKIVPDGFQISSFFDIFTEISCYIKIFPYTNSGANINYKTNGSVPELSPTTLAYPTDVLAVENNRYITGDHLHDVGYLIHSGSGTNPPHINATNLNYSGYPYSSGGSVSLSTTGEDVNRAFEDGLQTSGDIYCSFLINVSSAQTTGDYVFSLGPVLGTSGTDFKGRVYVKKDAASSNFFFGLSKAGTTVTYDTTPYTYGTTNLIVLKYSIIANATNDQVSMWVNPSIGVFPPTATLTAVASETDVTGGIGCFVLRQGSSSNAAAVLIDGICVSKAWFRNFGLSAIPPNEIISVGEVDVESDILLAYDNTLDINDPEIPELPNSEELVNPTVILFSAPSGTTDLIITVGAGTYYGVAYYNGIWNEGTPYPCTGPGTITFYDVPFGGKGDVPVVISEGDNPTLPVELSAFTATLTAQNYVVLNWTTQSESNLSGYYIYRNSINNLETATKIPSLVEATNTSQETDYTFTDQEVVTGGTYYYWLESVELNNQSNMHGPISIVLSAGNEVVPPVIPTTTRINSIYPNPFNPTTIISYSIAKAAKVTIDIYNVKGEKVRSLVNTSKNIGSHQIAWNGDDDNGKPCTSGIYYIKMTAGKYTTTQKAVLAK